MQTWLIYSFSALVINGLWGFCGKVASLKLNSQSIVIYQGIGIVASEILIFLYSGKGQQILIGGDAKSIASSIFTGIALSVGTMLTYAALKGGSVASVMAITSLYPVLVVRITRNGMVY